LKRMLAGFRHFPRRFLSIATMRQYPASRLVVVSDLNIRGKASERAKGPSRNQSSSPPTLSPCLCCRQGVSLIITRLGTPIAHEGFDGRAFCVESKECDPINFGASETALSFGLFKAASAIKGQGRGSAVQFCPSRPFGSCNI